MKTVDAFTKPVLNIRTTMYVLEHGLLFFIFL